MVWKLCEYACCAVHSGLSCILLTFYVLPYCLDKSFRSISTCLAGFRSCVWNMYEHVSEKDTDFSDRELEMEGPEVLRPKIPEELSSEPEDVETNV